VSWRDVIITWWGRMLNRVTAGRGEAHGPAELPEDAESSGPAARRRGPGDGGGLRRGPEQPSRPDPDRPEPELPRPRGQRRLQEQPEPQEHEERALDPEPTEGPLHLLEPALRQILRHRTSGTYTYRGQQLSFILNHLNNALPLLK
jgi:hypothetical protein